MVKHEVNTGRFIDIKSSSKSYDTAPLSNDLKMTVDS
jgi:hypothetical protein